MNFAAKSSMPLPSVTSVTLVARAPSSFSTDVGNCSGDGDCWASAGAISAAAPRMIVAMRYFMVGSPYLCESLFVALRIYCGSFLLRILVSLLQLRAHHLERVIG